MTYLGRKAYRMRIAFLTLNEKPLEMYLYAGENVLKGYVPAKGHNVAGFLWLTGIIL